MFTNSLGEITAYEFGSRLAPVSGLAAHDQSFNRPITEFARGCGEARCDLTQGEMAERHSWGRYQTNGGCQLVTACAGPEPACAPLDYVEQQKPVGKSCVFDGVPRRTPFPEKQQTAFRVLEQCFPDRSAMHAEPS
jgi:hypothetical protein